VVESLRRGAIWLIVSEAIVSFAHVSGRGDAMRRNSSLEDIVAITFVHEDVPRIAELDRCLITNGNITGTRVEMRHRFVS
jgi:hypothetical protein